MDWYCYAERSLAGLRAASDAGTKVLWAIGLLSRVSYQYACEAGAPVLSQRDDGR